jgi:hypothetical protein
VRHRPESLSFVTVKRAESTRSAIEVTTTASPPPGTASRGT